MLRRIAKLFRQPGFRQAPLAVLWRGAVWSINVALGRSPAFALVPGGAKLRVASDLRYTSVTAFLLRDAVEPELHHLQKLVPEGGVFVDVGANIGLFTLKAAPLASRVVAVEPGEAAGRQLDANVALNGYRHVSVVRKALSDAPGRAALFHNPAGDDPQAFSLISDGSATGSEPVELTTLDTLVAQLELPRVDCIKIDVEGAEAPVLAGGIAVLERDRPTVIFEMNCTTLDRSGGDPLAGWNRLAALGYGFYRMRDDGTLAAIAAPPADFCNVIARHPDGRRVRHGDGSRPIAT